MIIKERMKLSESRQFKMVFKDSVNDHNTLFGGMAMKWMDEVAYITAMRFCRKKVVTILVDKIIFKKPVPCGSIIELVSNVVDVGAVRLKVNVMIFVENKSNNYKEEAVNGSFYFAAIDNTGKVIRIN
jgi:acyl-CoA hydrolase